MTETLAEDQDKPTEIRLRVRWEDASDLPTLYANQVFITHAGGEFYVVFGELQPTVLMNVTPEQAQQLEEVSIRPVAKLVFSPDAIARIARAMHENVGKYEEHRSKEGDE